MNVPQNIIKLENDLENIIVLKNSVVKKQKYEEAARLRDDEKRIERDLISAQNEWDEQSKLNRIKVDESHISEVVSMISGVPVSKIFNKEKSKLSKLNNIIGDKLIGQKNAIEKVVKAIQRKRVCLVLLKNRLVLSYFLVKQGGKNSIS